MRLLFLLLISFNVWSQTSLDYQIYSYVIDRDIDRIDINRDSITRAMIFQQLIPPDNEIYYGEEFYNLEDEIRYSMLFNDTSTIKLIEDPKIKEALLTLEKEFFSTPIIDETKFHLKSNVSTIPKTKFDRFFKSTFGNKVIKGWKKFYRKNTDVFGIYGLSKIIYVDHYALFYMEHRAYGLYGSGDIYILRKGNDDWSIIKVLNIWMS